MKAALAVALAASTAAAAPTLVLNHSGRLLDGADHPVNGTVSLKFELHTSTAPGGLDSVAWTDTLDGVNVTAGVYDVTLGDTSVVGGGHTAFGPDAFSADRWLAISVDGEALSPWLRVGAVPYAVLAGSALDSARLGGQPADAFETAADAATKVATVTATPPLAADGTAADPVLSLPAASATSDGYLTKADYAAFAAGATIAPPLTRTSGAISLPAATASEDGYLAHADWASFNGKVSTTDPRLSDARAPLAGSASYVQNQTAAAQAASFNLSGTGTVAALGIGVAPPLAGLEVAGPIKSSQQIRAVAAGGSVAQTSALNIDWNAGNVQVTTAGCGAVTFQNMLEGGAYTLIVTGATSGTCTFSQSNPDALSNFKFQPANGPTAAGTTTVYTFLRAGGVVYASWITGF